MNITVRLPLKDLGNNYYLHIIFTLIICLLTVAGQMIFSLPEDGYNTTQSQSSKASIQATASADRGPP